MTTQPLVLGVSALYHDSAAALTQGDRILSASQEERFSRKKADWRFPTNAIKSCLNDLPVGQSIDALAFYENPLAKMSRMYRSAISQAPRGAPLWRRTLQSLQMLNWQLPAELLGILPDPNKVFFSPHHRSHAASAFWPSPFCEAAVVVVDGVGEFSTTTIWKGDSGGLMPIREIQFPNSLGLLYSAFTQYCGFKVNSGEYKLMGLAPFGKPTFKQQILDEFIALDEDGAFRLNLQYFAFHRTLSSISPFFEQGLGQPARLPNEPITQHHMDVAASIQAVLDLAMIRLVEAARKLTGLDNVCLAGGVALNCVANGKLADARPRGSSIWVQPAAGDAGGAIGAALDVSKHLSPLEGTPPPKAYRQAGQAMNGAFLGPQFDNRAIELVLSNAKLKFDRIDDEQRLLHQIAEALAEGLVVGHFDGRMEFGPRALGNRSILADPRPRSMLNRVNRKVKFRETWRPFAPMILEEECDNYFEGDYSDQFMLFVSKIKEQLRGEHTIETVRAAGASSPVALQKKIDSQFSAVTHVDFSSRVQIIGADSNSRARQLLEAFHEATSCPMLLNTSFNVRGEPIVCSPKDAIACFLNTDLDLLAIGPFLVWKDRQSAADRAKMGRTRFDAD